MGMPEIARRCVNIFEVSMTPEEFVQRYGVPLSASGIIEGGPTEQIEQARTALGVEERDAVVGTRMVRV